MDGGETGSLSSDDDDDDGCDSYLCNVMQFFSLKMNCISVEIKFPPAWYSVCYFQTACSYEIFLHFVYSLFTLHPELNCTTQWAEFNNTMGQETLILAPSRTKLVLFSFLRHCSPGVGLLILV